jgi:hypothetical protein
MVVAMVTAMMVHRGGERRSRNHQQQREGEKLFHDSILATAGDCDCATFWLCSQGLPYCKTFADSSERIEWK